MAQPLNMGLSQSQTPDAHDTITDFPEAQYQDKTSFTMIILDFDDTLVPTAMRKTLNSNFKIDLFKLKRGKTKLIKQLQINIVDSLHALRDKCPNFTQIALVSNGSPNWLKQMFSMPLDEDDEKDIFRQLVASSGNDYKKEKIRLNIMSKYFKENNVSIHSATREMKDNNKKGKRWLIKYKTIKALISEKTKELNMPCSQVISVGDGKYEKEAIRKYSTKYDIRCIHFALVKAPSCDQLQQQWEIIERANISGVTSETTQYFIFDMSEVLPNDNNDDCTGKTHQLPSISEYFRYWLKTLNIQNGKKAKYSSQTKLNSLADRIMKQKTKMIQKGKYEKSSYKKIVDALCVVHPPLKKDIKKIEFEW